MTSRTKERKVEEQLRKVKQVDEHTPKVHFPHQESKSERAANQGYLHGQHRKNIKVVLRRRSQGTFNRTQETAHQARKSIGPIFQG